MRLELPTKVFIANEWLDQLLQLCLTKKLSDLHLEPTTQGYRLRVRCDGLLHEAFALTKEQGGAVLNRIKVLSQLDIAEQRRPQDGRLIDKNFLHADFRISTCPTVHGEKCVLRNLSSLENHFSINDLGMNEAQKKIFNQALKKPQGLILVTGPTGSGKTVTLYSALQALNDPKRNLISIEDPVEIRLNGINQINIHPQIGLGFSEILRAVLRQDPDIVMVGEMRDQETAEIAISAAQTGHLVFSTLHTQNALRSITRLENLGIEREQWVSALSLVIAQRLIRKRCSHCQSGCEHCHEGFSGRTGIYEMIIIDENLKEELLKKDPTSILLEAHKNKPWASMLDHAKEKISEGITSHEEVERVLGV